MREEIALFSIAEKLHVDIDIVRHEWSMSKLNEWLAYFEIKKEIVDKLPASSRIPKPAKTNPHHIVRQGDKFIRKN